MNDRDIFEQQRAAENELGQQKQEKLTALDQEHSVLPQHLDFLPPSFQREFVARYFHGLALDLDNTSRQQDTVISRPIMDFSSKKVDLSPEQEYKGMLDFQQAVKSRDDLPPKAKALYERAIEETLNLLRPEDELGESQPFLSKQTTPVVRALAEELYTLSKACDRAPNEDKVESFHQAHIAIGQAGRLLEERIHPVLLEESAQYEAQAQALIIRLGEAFDYCMQHRTNQPQSMPETFAMSFKAWFSGHSTIEEKAREGLRKFQSEVAKHYDDFIDAIKKPLSELKILHARLSIQQTYISEIKKTRQPGFALLRECQSRQQEYLKKAMQLQGQIIRWNQRFYKLERDRSLIPGRDIILERLKERSKLLIETRHIQQVLDRHQATLSQICGSRQTSISESAAASTPNNSGGKHPDQSTFSFALVPLLVAKSEEKEEAASVVYYQAGDNNLNKSNLDSRTMLHDAANKQSYLLVNGAKVDAGGENAYQVIKLNNPTTLEEIQATEFGTHVTGQITQTKIELRKGTSRPANSEKRSSQSPKR